MGAAPVELGQDGANKCAGNGSDEKPENPARIVGYVTWDETQRELDKQRDSTNDDGVACGSQDSSHEGSSLTRIADEVALRSQNREVLSVGSWIHAARSIPVSELMNPARAHSMAKDALIDRLPRIVHVVSARNAAQRLGLQLQRTALTANAEPQPPDARSYHESIGRSCSLSAASPCWAARPAHLQLKTPS